MKFNIVLSLVLLAGPYQVSAQSDLIGCYQLDNNALDFSGYNHNGISYNVTPAMDRNSIANRAYHFDGNHSGMLVNVSPYRLNTFTYSVWCKPDNLPYQGGYYSIIAVGGFIADQALLLGNNPGINHVGFGFGSWDSIPTPHHCYVGTLPNINQWYHIVFTRDDDSLKLYIDNNFICYKLTGQNAGYIGTQQEFSIGCRIDTAIQNYVGDIDEVKVFDRVLSFSEIISLDASCKYVSTGIDDEENKLSLSNNSFSHEIILNGIANNSDVIVFDILGNVLFEQKTEKNILTIATENYRSGVYILQYINEGKAKTFRFIR